MRDSFADGCWLVELSPLRGAGTPRAHRVRRRSGCPTRPRATRRGCSRRTWRSVSCCSCSTRASTSPAPARELAELLLPAAPGLRILATSRAPLGLPAEHSLLVNPLEVRRRTTRPPPTPTRSPCSSTGPGRRCRTSRSPRTTPPPSPSCAAGSTGSRWPLSSPPSGCAACPSRRCSPGSSDRFRVLGTARTATDRHRTLRAAVSWSYELCTPAEQKLWAELSVFPGGFALRRGRARLRAGHRRDAAPSGREVGRPGAIEPTDRYQLLDTMREFGAERLAAGARRPRRCGPGTATTTWGWRSGPRPAA